MGRPKKSSTATAAKKGAKSSKSAAAVKGQATLKTQTTLKNSLTKSTTSTAASGIKFKASKVTRASEKKKEKEAAEEVVKVEVEKKAVVEEVASTTTATNATAATTTTTTSVESKETKEEKVPVTPRKTRNKRTIEDVLEDSVSKRVKLDDTADEPVQTPTPSKRRTTSSAPATASSKVSKPIEQEEKGDDEEEEEEEEDNALPKRIIRLITIHNSIISLLLLDYATQPAILAEYLPQISRNANTNITLVDLQRIVTLSEGTIRLLVVENRGNAIELVNGVNWKTSNLGQKFKARIEKWWEGKTKAERKDEDKLLGSIELAEILPENTTSSTSSSQATTGLQTPPVTPSKPKGVTTTPLSKGQRRLQDLKNFTLSKQTSLSPSPSKKKENISLSTGNSPSVANRKSSLLERIRAKAQAANSAPAPPPPAVLQRRTAMQWLESIIPILLQLTTPVSTLGAKSKLHVPSTTSFPMTTVIQNVKTSLQKPIASEDIERSLRLLADEIATDFVKIVEWKGDSTGSPLIGVVFNRNGRAKVEGWKYIEEE
ncbi:hypothetical protein AOL_s00075g131 [Orbilia oligospora ATCC 24927]|uniref:DNA replication factor Cdt1 C-terminal domain-containing protein n=2 Tax=Orbilia oligospora TaxID=2813651 RepID=G1X8D2_ARTOA|nr:hypothetical protein AOL_s00075g131 [Orbilia oligospora ATCC 24927]EGX50705.1 hypothetical protein AOL_s00075g131 [Orbilia oligospora ATCC 24927]KAF3281951.1 hypothetical protein TWF970_001901 [Orbilia oligospora]